MLRADESILPAVMANAALGEREAVRFLTEGLADGPSEVLSYAGFDARVRTLAGHLRELGLTGQPALLLFAPGLDFIVAFFACLYEGVVAVPAYPPDVSRLERSLPRLRAIARDCRPAAVLTSALIAEAAPALLPEAPELAQARWVAVDGPEAASAQPIAEARLRAGRDLAFLQYTSGSTAAPRGVRVTHGNILHNSEAIRSVGRHDRDSVAVAWLPSYHDMGLIGAVIQPLYVGFPSVLMSPLAFLKRPASWLEAISRYRGTTSAFPNFALDLCCKRISDAERQGLDLRSWRIAWNGAEPVRRASLERFAERFGPCGFDQRAFWPVYGLAEATLIVSGERASAEPRALTLSREGLARHRLQPQRGPGDEAALVSCGRPVAGLEVAVVDPERGTPCAPDRVGELWVRGPSVADGYWGASPASTQAFGAQRPGEAGPPFLRTGDLGFLSEGEVFVTGRLKDLIIIRGENLYPQDLEEAALGAHPAVRSGGCAAVSLEAEGGEQLAIAAEVRDGLEPGALEEAVRAIRAAVSAISGVAPARVALLPAGALPKTSSGKVQRYLCREALASGELPVLLLDQEATTPAPSPLPLPLAGEGRGEGAGLERPHPSPLPQAGEGEGRQGQPAVRQRVLEVLARTSGYAAETFRDETQLVAYLGFDSLRIAEIEAELEKALGSLGGGLFDDVDLTFGALVGEIEARLVGTLKPALAEAPAPTPVAEPEPVRPAPPRVVAREERIEDFAEVTEIRSMLMLFGALEQENPFFRSLEGPARETARVAGRELLNFATYNYLGLSGDPRVSAAATRAVARYGTSASASRVASGERPVHRSLEAALAAFLGCEDALVFPSGHATNVAAIATLVGRDDLVVYDSLAHDSVLAGARLSGAHRLAFPHNDLDALERILAERRGLVRRALVVVEGAYSMDGDLAPLAELVALKKRHGALLMVDEAHSLGVVGPTGRGLGEQMGVARADVDVWMGTLSKALASCGGYVAGSRALIDLLKYKAGGFVYAAAISPANAAAAEEALRILQAEPERVLTLQRRARRFAQLCAERGIDTGRSAGTAVVPAIVGASVRCIQVAAALERRGVHAPPIFHPAVEEDRARLRFFITALHSEAQLQRAAEALAEALAEHPMKAQPGLAGLARRAARPAPAPAPAPSYRRVLVTGASGFIGSRVARQLRAQGAEVRCLLRPTSKTHRLAGVDYQVARGDVLDAASVAQAAQGCDAVVHLACASSWADVRSLGEGIFAVAEEGTRNVLQAARAAGVRRVVHVSSVAALNASERPEVFDEGASYQLQGRGLLYSLAKRRAEDVALQFAREGLEVVIASPAEVFGPEDDGWVTAGSVLDILQASPAVACEGGTSVAHVDDVAEGVVAALGRGRPGERYILGGDNLSVHELSELVLRLAGRPASVVDIPKGAAKRLCQGMARLGLAPPISLDVLEYATLYWFVDSAKARRELGYRPRGAEHTLAPVVQWLKASGHLADRKARAPAHPAPTPTPAPAPVAPQPRRAGVDHTVVSVSLGARNRDHAVEVELLGKRFSISRRGTGGDFEAFVRTFRELDGQVDAFGVGGAEFHMGVAGQRYEWRQLRPVREAIRRSKVGDGNGIKHLLARSAVQELQRQGYRLEGRRALVTAAVDRYGLATALLQAGCEMTFADLMMIGVPVPLHSLEAIHRLAPMIMPALSRLPFSWVYPVGEDDARLPARCTEECRRADVIAGDYLQVQANLPERLTGKVIITNTTTARDVEELTRKNLHLLVTTTPRMEGRSFGTNVMEAVCRCLIDKPDHLITDADFLDLIERIPLKPQVHVLNPA